VDPIGAVCFECGSPNVEMGLNASHGPFIICHTCRSSYWVRLFIEVS